MSTAFDVKKHVYTMLETDYTNTVVDVWFGTNTSLEGTDFIEIMGIVWDQTEYDEFGDGGDSGQLEDFRIAMAITCMGVNTDHQTTEQSVWDIYNNIDSLVKADVSFGGLVGIHAMCSPEQLISGSDSDNGLIGTTLRFFIECKSTINI